MAEELYHFPGLIPDYLYRFYEDQVVIKNHSENTAYKYAFNVSLFMRYLLYTWGAPDDNKDVDTVTKEQMAAVTPDQITAFLFYQYKNDVGPFARAATLSSLVSFYNYLIEKEKCCERNPAADIERPKLPQTLPKYLTEAEAESLLDTIQASKKINGPRDYCIISIFLVCGLRLDELRKINVDDIDKDSRILTVVGKGSKTREVYLNDRVLGGIDDWMVVRNGIDKPEGEKALFITRQGGHRITKSTIQKMVERRFLEAGLDAKNLSTHKLRHTAATLMYESSDGDIRTLQEILGHASLSTTQIYTHVNNKRKAEMIDNSPLNIKEESRNRTETE